LKSPCWGFFDFRLGKNILAVILMPFFLKTLYSCFELLSSTYTVLSPATDKNFALLLTITLHWKCSVSLNYSKGYAQKL